MIRLNSFVKILSVGEMSTKKLNRIAFLCPIIALIFAVNGNAQYEDTNSNSTCTSDIYSDNSYLKKANSFFAYDDVYLKFDCSISTPGDHTINLEWTSPKGELQRNSSHSFVINAHQSYVAFFSFKLNRKGIFSQILSGEEFAASQYGEWKIISYLDGHRIGENLFHIVK